MLLSRSPVRLALPLSCVLAWPLFGSSSAAAHGSREETVSPQFAQPLPNVAGKSFITAIVNFAPGAKAQPHRHGQAFVYAYVLQGAVRSAVDDQATRVYRVGENWSEPPGAYHPLTENASSTKTARLLVVFIANTGDALKTPTNPEGANR